MTAPAETLDPEAVRWLRSAAGRWLGSGPGSTPAEKKEVPEDWDAVAEGARRHNLEPLLFELSESGLLTGVPAETLDAWEGQYYRNQIFNLSLLETLAELLERALRSDIEPIVLKGPVSIARRLKDPGLRVMVDVDLLCRQRDLEPLVEAARELGFQTVGENATYHLSLQHPALGAGLELHFDLYEVLDRRREFIEEVFEGAERLEVEGCSFRAPSREADLVLQLAHILHHDQRVDLRHWLDFASAAGQAGERDELERLLKLADLEPEFEEAVAIARHLFEGDGTALEVDSELPGHVEAALLDLTDRRALLSGARMYPGWWARLGYVARLLVPSPRRWRALAASEGTGIGRALLRHLTRAFGRGMSKIEHRDQKASPADSPRARLFRRRRLR
ncbi:MAG: nucleotidyltransferase family protein [Thermoanaerobaculia bacterium]